MKRNSTASTSRKACRSATGQVAKGPRQLGTDTGSAVPESALVPGRSVRCRLGVLQISHSGCERQFLPDCECQYFAGRGARRFGCAALRPARLSNPRLTNIITEDSRYEREMTIGRLTDWRKNRKSSIIMGRKFRALVRGMRVMMLMLTSWRQTKKV